MSRVSSSAQGDGGGPSDLDLVAESLRGDVLAREQLAERLVELPALVRARHVRMGSPLPEDLVEDVVQNLLLSLWGKLPAYDGRVPLLSWAMGFATFEILRAIGARNRLRERNVELGDLEDRRRSPSLEATERLAELLARLPHEDRELLRHKHIEDRTFAEIAALSRSPVASVKTRYYRALQVLERLLHPGEEMPT